KAKAPKQKKQKKLKPLKAPKPVKVKLTKEQKREAAAAALATKKRDKQESKDAKKARDEAYKEALERWKVDRRIARENGAKPPKKPRAPKNDTSKPSPVDINNAVRALATMLENTPGELDAIGAMVSE